MIRIYFTYRHVDKPWGGANNFIRVLNKSLPDGEGFRLTKSFEEPCDLLFMNQLGAGPGSDFKEWQLSEIKNRLCNLGLNESSRRPALAVRAVNLRRNVDLNCGMRTRLLGYLQDRKVVALLNMADLAIFQSDYQKQVFVEAGYRGRHSVVIHNGADHEFWEQVPQYAENDNVLKVIATSISIRSIKRHDLIARFSTLPNVEVTYVGNWPSDVAPEKVKLCGVLDRVQIKELMREHHYFFHPATRDACPNSILEALSVGLPVIYSPQPGSSAELVQDAGIALDEANLSATLHLAQAELELRRSRVLQRRKKFVLEIVVHQYAEAFRQLIQTKAE